ncbi:transcription elongation factor GreA [Patescibacteria group bacterium]|nr:transcription elongation factor GreA [Patescibacteria group bacterium]
MSQSQNLYISRRGLEEIKAELAQLLGDRKIITAKIKEAREFGDLSENAEYTEAKTKQSFIEGRIVEIEMMLKVAKVIDENNHKNGIITLGSKVKLDNGKEYEIAGSNEASPEQGKISNESPIGMALLGRLAGDTIEINTPDGVKKYTVISVN